MKIPKLFHRLVTSISIMLKNLRYTFTVFLLFAIVSIIGLGSEAKVTSGTKRKSNATEKILSAGLQPYVLKLAMKGVERLSSTSRSIKMVGIIDYSKPSTEKRLYIIDPSTGELLYHSLVAHGKNSGEITATRFSNVTNSLQSSLGFFLTGSLYNGKHGTSLQLIGCEKGINDRALDRGIVLHGADYVSEHFIRENNRLGRSFGCPAVSTKDLTTIINLLKDNGCLFVYAADKEYLRNSRLIR